MTVITVLENSLRIAWKDIRAMSRMKGVMVMLILMPIFMMVMVGFIYPSGSSVDMSSLKVQVINQDIGYNNVSLSGIFTSAFTVANNNSTKMQLFTGANGTNEDTLKDSIKQGDFDAGIIIPENFTYCILTKQKVNITVITDNSNPQISQYSSAALQGLVGAGWEGLMIAPTVNQQIAQLFSYYNLTDPNAGYYMAPYAVASSGVVGGANTNYFEFIAPAMIMMTVMFSVMTNLPQAITHERELGTLDGIMVAPINRLSIIVGKTLSSLVYGLIQGLIIMALSIGLFGVTIQGNILLVFGLLFLGVFSFVGLGIALTSLAKDQQTASMIMMTLTFPMMILSGIFFPIKMMPQFMQYISDCLPLTYAADAMRKVMVLGANVSQISTDLIVLIVFGIVMLVIAVPIFRRMMTR